MANIELHAALRSNARNEAILGGRARPQGIDLRRSRFRSGEVPPADAEVTEISFAHHLASLGRGDDSKVGVPIFSTRGFPHTGLVVRTEAGIDAPGSLSGKKVGVADLGGSDALWTRGILVHEFGVAASSIDWYGEHQPTLDFGSGNLVSRDTTIAHQLLGGQLDAALLSSDLGLAEVPVDSSLRRLFADPRAEARRYHDKTGFFPISTVVVVSRDVVRRFPWVVLNLYSAFLDSKLQAMAEAGALLAPYLDAGVIDAATGKALSTDIYAYGVTPQKDLLETAAAYAHEQGLSSTQLGLEQIFYPPTLEL